MDQSRRTVLVGLVATLVLAGLPPTGATGTRSCSTGRSARPPPATDTPPHRLNPASAGRILNAMRAARGCGTLVANDTLQAMATRQARRMAERGELSHHVDFGRNVQVRADSAGYPGLVAENLASGYLTFEDCITAWLDSPSHRTSMIDSSYRRFGAAVATTPGSRPDDHDIFWCLELGT